jgi:hypothetical protein
MTHTVPMLNATSNVHRVVCPFPTTKSTASVYSRVSGVWPLHDPLQTSPSVCPFRIACQRKMKMRKDYL